MSVALCMWLLAAAPLPRAGVVLCVAGSGHFGIELSHVEACGEPAEHDDAQRHDGYVAGSPRCQDTELATLLPPSPRPPQQRLQLPAMTVICLPPTLSNLEADARLSVFPRPARQAAPPPPALDSSIVLLI